MPKTTLSARVAASQEDAFERLHRRLVENGTMSGAISSRAEPPHMIAFTQAIGKGAQQTLTLELAQAGPGSSTLTFTVDQQVASGEGGAWLMMRALKRQYQKSLDSYVSVANGAS